MKHDSRNIIKVKKLNPNAKLPTTGSAHSAGWDLYAAVDESVNILPGQVAKIPTGIAVETPEGYFAGIFPRSGTATKKGLRLANGVGVCDSDYRGEFFVPIYNDSEDIQCIEPGERFAQMIFIPYLPCTLIESEEISDTKRGSGGFGSTGTK